MLPAIKIMEGVKNCEGAVIVLTFENREGWGS
jgi:hypothetical protein